MQAPGFLIYLIIFIDIFGIDLAPVPWMIISKSLIVFAVLSIVFSPLSFANNKRVEPSNPFLSNATNGPTSVLYTYFMKLLKEARPATVVSPVGSLIKVHTDTQPQDNDERLALDAFGLAYKVTFKTTNSIEAFGLIDWAGPILQADMLRARIFVDLIRVAKTAFGVLSPTPYLRPKGVLILEEAERNFSALADNIILFDQDNDFKLVNPESLKIILVRRVAITLKESGINRLPRIKLGPDHAGGSRGCSSVL